MEFPSNLIDTRSGTPVSRACHPSSRGVFVFLAVRLVTSVRDTCPLGASVAFASGLKTTVAEPKR